MVSEGNARVHIYKTKSLHRIEVILNDFNLIKLLKKLLLHSKPRHLWWVMEIPIGLAITMPWRWTRGCATAKLKNIRIFDCFEHSLYDRYNQIDVESLGALEGVLALLSG